MKIKIGTFEDNKMLRESLPHLVSNTEDIPLYKGVFQKPANWSVPANTFINEITSPKYIPLLNPSHLLICSQHAN